MCDADGTDFSKSSQIGHTRVASAAAGGVLGGAPLVPVMEAADLGDRDDVTPRRRLRRSRMRRVFGQRQMRPGPMIVREVSCQHAAQMPLAEDDDVIQTLAADPISRSTYGFCHGLDGAETTSVIPMPATR
jgi:hypothetical protein